MSTPAPTGNRYVPATRQLNVIFRHPVKDCRSRRVMYGAIQGVMYRNGVVHHYRVAGNDGVFYFAPPSWFRPGHIDWFEKAAFAVVRDRDRVDALFDLILAQQQARRDGMPA